MTKQEQLHTLVNKASLWNRLVNGVFAISVIALSLFTPQIIWGEGNTWRFLLLLILYSLCRVVIDRKAYQLVKCPSCENSLWSYVPDFRVPLTMTFCPICGDKLDEI